MEHDNPIVESLDNTGLPPWDDGQEPICPICEEPCETIYFNIDGDAVGCENCLTPRDAWDLMLEEDLL